MDCFVACAPLRKRFAFVAGNDGSGIHIQLSNSQASPRIRILAARIAPELCVTFALENRGRREGRAPAGTRGLVCKCT